MVAVNCQDFVAGQQIQQLANQPVGIVAWPVENVAEQNREQLLFQRGLQAEFEFGEGRSRVIVAAETWNVAGQVRVADECQAAVVVRAHEAAPSDEFSLRANRLSGSTAPPQIGQVGFSLAHANNSVRASLR